MIEKQLKLGLLSSTIEAQRNLYLENPESENVRKIFIVPVTLNYHFVLEAPELVDDYLSVKGQDKYLPEQDKYGSWQLTKFLFKFFTKGSNISVSIGSPLDIMGNYVDEEGKWLWGGDMGLPREVSADSHGHLSISLPQEVQEHISRTYQPVSRAEKLEDLHLTSLGATATIWPDLSCGMRDLYIRFDIKTCDAHSFGMLLHPSGDGKAHKLQISPSAKGDYTVSLFTDFPPLDDFWADQYKLYVPRPVDGPELVRHESLDLSTGITVLIKGQTVQVLCGGRSLCFRLPTPAATPVASFGWFVEDGTIELTNLDVRLSSNKSRI